ncbi:hypothetical protein N185_07955 [Sinorhizobium sp. GW3]|nr:hypothetical protein N185_07955 [Sinorhizobium sp. GW3]
MPISTSAETRCGAMVATSSAHDPPTEQPTTMILSPFSGSSAARAHASIVSPEE